MNLFATTDAVKIRLGMDPTTQSQEPTLTAHIANAQSLFEAMTSRHFEFDADEIDCKILTCRQVYLARYPLQSIASVKINSDVTTPAVLLDLESDMRVHEPLGLIELTEQRFREHRDKLITIEYAGGYDLLDPTNTNPPGLPEEIANAVAEQAATWFTYRLTPAAQRITGPGNAVQFDKKDGMNTPFFRATVHKYTALRP